MHMTAWTPEQTLAGVSLDHLRGGGGIGGDQGQVIAGR
jgi:hypothetical protein